MRLRGGRAFETICKCTQIGAMAPAIFARWRRRASRAAYEYIAVTDHSKGLSIANGINEAKLKKQSAEIEAINSELRAGGKSLTILHSIEMNLNPLGAGDMEPAPCARLISSSVRSIPCCGARTTRPNVISRPFAIRTFRFSATP